MFYDPKSFLEMLPSAPSPVTTDKYRFLDTRKVVENMHDLGYEVFGARKSNTRTRNGVFGMHEVDFRRPQDLGLKDFVKEMPRVLFINSYDGTKRAQFMAGLIRFACSNGMLVGSHLSNEKFLHQGDEIDGLLDSLASVVKRTDEVFDQIEDYRTKTLDQEIYLDLAARAAALRFEETVKVEPLTLIQPRRKDDTPRDLYTVFNVVQENILRGGVPIINEKGQSRLSSPVNNIDRSNRLNQELWGLLEEFAEA